LHLTLVSFNNTFNARALGSQEAWGIVRQCSRESGHGTGLVGFQRTNVYLQASILGGSPAVFRPQNRRTQNTFSKPTAIIRDKTKLEYIPRIMKKKNIDAYLIQDHYIINHGPETQPYSGAKSRVAIMLSPNGNQVETQKECIQEIIHKQDYQILK